MNFGKRYGLHAAIFLASIFACAPSQAGVQDWAARKAIESVGKGLVPKEGKIHDGTLNGEGHKTWERQQEFKQWQKDHGINDLNAVEAISPRNIVRPEVGPIYRAP